MDRTKKIWSIVLLCAEILLAVLLVVLVIFADELVLGGMAASETKAEALVGVLLVIAALIYILPLVGMFFGAIGFVLSLVNIKIAQSKVIKGISIGFCVLYSLLLLAGVAFGVYFVIQFNGLMF